MKLLSFVEYLCDKLVYYVTIGIQDGFIKYYRYIAILYQQL